QLDDRISAQHAKTGQSIEYEFNVYGEGNISSIQRPVIEKDDNFDFYEPNVQQNITRENSKVTGTKSFRYFLVPKEPGQFEMGRYFQWIYFNTHKRTYDTLRSKIVLAVEGESQRNQAIQSTDLGSFYDRVNVVDNSLHATAQIGWMKWGMNSLIALMLAGAVWLVFSARPKG
ncbi:MAG TPA: BatD family protein, partial [Cyclobacteriaceae bacterium]|nr:BatD family protein [Cyclobacteriaceae bacterium]